jgi:hypothetical protein
VTQPFPFQPLAPVKRFRDMRCCQAWPIMAQAERKYSYESTAQPPVVYEDWRQADREHGDLLYVGAASSTLLNRLHPTSHAMWSVVYKHRLFPRIRIAVWSMPPSDCYEIEAWMAHHYRPLWSGAVQNEVRAWLYRAPDAVFKPQAFDPRKRVAPIFAQSNTGVYAWLLAPQEESEGWVEHVMVDGAAARALKVKPHGPAYPFFCHNCGRLFKRRPARCPHCGKTETEAAEAHREQMERALSGIYEK